jgi:aldehyde dehydrogenase (NAD+)
MSRPAVIGGALVATTESLDVLDPATGELLERTARGGHEEVDAAVAAARTASAAWRRMPATERSAALLRLSATIRDEHEALAVLESSDTGKPVTQARADVTVAARYFEYYAHCLEAFYGSSLPPNGEFVSYTRPTPFGVTGHIIPWNYPLQIACRTIAPAIAVGNCAVVKPAEDAPLSVLRLARLALDAGLPAGVLNVVPGLGTEAGAALAAHPGIDHLSFTGSVDVGSMVARAAAGNVIPTALELGGKSPNIVFPDADLDAAIPIIARSVLQNAGQTCSAGSRLLVHSDVHGEVVRRLAQVLRGTRIGRGLDDPDLGPLISAKQHARVTAMVGRAASAGAAVVVGADDIPVPDRGFFYSPTLIDGVDPASEIARDEVFGPVVACSLFDSVDDAIRIANGTDYGLIAAVWTKSLDVAHVLSEEILAGQVYVNTYGAGGGVEYPFGGFKKSGYGREKGYEALNAFCQTKTVVLKLSR